MGHQRHSGTGRPKTYNRNCTNKIKKVHSCAHKVSHKYWSSHHKPLCRNMEQNRNAHSSTLPKLVNTLHKCNRIFPYVQTIDMHLQSLQTIKYNPACDYCRSLQKSLKKIHRKVMCTYDFTHVYYKVQKPGIMYTTAMSYSSFYTNLAANRSFDQLVNTN